MSIEFFEEFGADPEGGGFFGGNLDGFSVAGVAPLVCLIVFVGKRAETSEFDAAVFVEGADDGVKAEVDNFFRLVMGKEGFFLQSRYQL